MRVLLTGSDGQVGSALSPLLEHEAKIFAPSIAEFDLARPDSLPEQLDIIRPDLIINAAAYTAVDRAEDERDLAFLINAKGPEVLAKWTAKRGVPLIHFSTDYVFDGSGSLPRSEHSATGPLSVYGASKLAGDQAIQAAGGPHLIARTSWVYASQGTNFLRTIARLAAERKELRVVADQVGAPTTARAIAGAIFQILKPNLPNLNDAFISRGGLLNLVCAGETSWHGFATEIVDGLKSRGHLLAVEKVIPIRSEEFPSKAKRPLNSRLDLRRLRDDFGINMPNWIEALEMELNALPINADRFGS